jgi:hypothetical protein
MYRPFESLHSNADPVVFCDFESLLFPIMLGEIADNHPRWATQSSLGTFFLPQTY